MGWLTCLGTGASKLSKTCTKQAAREEESPQKHSHDRSRLLWKQWLVNRATLIWDPGACLLLFGLLSCVSSSCVLQGICKPLLQWYPTPVLLPGKSHGWRSLVGCSPWFRYKSDTTEWLHFHFSFSRIGEGNGNPLQCSCLENPRDVGAWWAAIYGVTQSRTWLKWLSSSIEYRACRYFLLFLRLCFNSVGCLFCSAEAF